MLKKSRIVVGLLTVFLCAGSMAGAVSAAETAANVPEISLTTNRSEYSGDEKIKETVTIQNTTEGYVTDITIRSSIPEGYVTDDGKEFPDQWTSSISEVAAGDTSEVAVTFSKKNTAGPDSTQSNAPTDDSRDENKPSEDKNTTTEGGKDSVDTGDSYQAVLWFLICLVGLTGAIVLVVIIKDKKSQKIFSLFLAIIMAGSLSQTGEFYVRAADLNTVNEHTTEKTVELAREVTVDGEKVTLTAQVTYHVATIEDGTEDMKSDLSYEGYNLKWQDEFEGAKLNRDDWNVELHDPGWVNAEWQEYVDSEENIYLEDGKLVVKPIKTVDENGNVSYTSGRINTQNKETFTYGLFEARVKVPEGKGYLPAFWLMANDENLYGQWPRCGEIDIMEVLGDATNTAHGTIHYGNPHNQSQGTYVLEEGSFSDGYHTFAMEWEPGKISWYVDGQLYHTESEWFSATEGQGELTYPAPFDQPFYVILNLAVGGSWVGYPDETTDFENASYEVDYVRVYQKDSYDENVTKPEKEVILRDPDETGNYIVNGDFSVAEDLTDDQDWSFLTAQGGEATAKIEDNEISISTANPGTVDYSVQLVQPNLPMKKGGTYELTFDAYADETRTMIVDISAPDNNWIRYLSDTKVDLTTEKQTYTYGFTMTNEDDANGRLEFNMGNTDSTADIRISNVSLKMIAYEEIIEEEVKTVLSDGNYVYNGSFQEGTNRLGYWDIINPADAEVSVTNENNVRRLKIVAPEGTSAEKSVIVSQSGLALAAGGQYVLDFDAEGESGNSIKATAGGVSFDAALTGEEQIYTYKFSPAADADKGIVFEITEPGTFYLDEVRIVEDSLIKNGSFSAGFSGYEPFVDSSISSDVAYVVDSLNEDNAADFTINNTGDQAWKIQLKQNNVELEKGQWYRLSLDAKSSIVRQLMFAIQRNGNLHNDDWTPYSGEKIVDLSSDYQTYTIEFQMNQETDAQSVLSISMGAVGGNQITQHHRICIDNITLEKIDAPAVEEIPAGENLLKNSDFSAGSEGWINAITAPGAADVSFENNEAVYNITDIGTADWNVQLKQEGITLEEGCSYQIKFKAVSTKARTIKLAMLSPSYEWYGGADIALEKEVVIDLTMVQATDANTTMVVSMGVIDGIDTPLSAITLSDFSLVKTN